jgi:hypothetical protein
MADKTPEETAAEAATKVEADLAALRAEVEEANTKRDAAEKLMRKATAELQKVQTQRKAADAGMTEEKLKELRAEARAEVEAELKPKLEENERLKGQNRALLLDADMKARGLKAGILPTKIDDWWKLRGSEYDLTDDGKPMVKGKPGLDPDKHLTTLLKLNPEWVAGTKAGGGGAEGGTKGATGVTDEDLKHPERLIAAGNATT